MSTRQPIAERLVSRRRFLTGALGAAVGAALHGTMLLPYGSAAGGRKTITIVDPFEPASYVDGGGVFLQREGIAEGLVAVGFDTKFEPALATDWQQVDNTLWRIKLRRGVRFHNGTMLDADAVRVSLERAAERRDALAALRGLRVTRETASTILIRTDIPVPYMPAFLADGRAMILEPSSFASGSPIATPIGTGPFRLVAWRPGDRRVLERHEAYWRGRPPIAEVQYLRVPSAQTRLNMVRTGAADIARIIAPSDVPTVRHDVNLRLLMAPLPRRTTLYLNTKKPPLDDLRVRQALGHAIDRTAIVKAALEGLGDPQVGLFRPEYPWGNPHLKGLVFDPPLARAKLIEAGYGTKPLSITLATYSVGRPELPDVAQVLQQQWAQVGIETRIAIMEYAVLEAMALRGEHDAVLVSRNPLLMFDPQSLLESDFATGGALNLSHYSRLDDEIRTAGGMINSKARYDAIRRIERQIIEQDVAVIVVAGYVQIDAVRRTVKGYRPHPVDLIALTATIDKE
jgi:peptide/nickel transport system substrate-binding protein